MVQTRLQEEVDEFNQQHVNDVKDSSIKCGFTSSVRMRAKEEVRNSLEKNTVTSLPSEPKPDVRQAPPPTQTFTPEKYNFSNISKVFFNRTPFPALWGRRHI